MKNNIIFKYQLKDAWGMERSMIEITEEKENNILIKEYDKEDITYASIDSNIIKEIIKKYSEDLKKCKEFPHAFVSDGYINLFYFNINNRKYEIEINNLCYLEPNDKNVKLILDIYKELYKILSPILDNRIKKSFVLKY